MRVCVVSPRPVVSAREILSFLSLQTADLVLLPGVSANTPSVGGVQRAIRSGVSVFVEGGTAKRTGRPMLVTKTGARAMPRQLFGSRPSAADVDELIALLNDRTFAIGRRKVTFVICGEINAFDVHGKAKFGRSASPIDILANPAHTPMGRWHVLDRKFKALSKKGAALHVTNNTRKGGRLRPICVFTPVESRSAASTSAGTLLGLWRRFDLGRRSRAPAAMPKHWPLKRLV